MRVITFVVPALVSVMAAASVNAATLPSAQAIGGTNSLLTLAQAKKAEDKKATKSAAKKKSASKKKTAAKQKRRVRRSFASLTCSVEANKKGLKGAKRKAYRKICLRAASACTVTARKKGLKGRARTAFRKQCITIAARKAAA